jgi:hypothetical protein
LLGFLLGCEKEKQSYFEPERTSQALPSCDDTSDFKSTLDLEPLDHIEDCYLASATKAVPGLDSVVWTLNNHATIGLGMGLNLYTSIVSGWFNYLYLREEITMGVPISVGLHPLSSASYIRYLDDGDVFDAEWILDTNCSSYVEITQLDLECREVRGNFELHFILKEQSSFFQYSERVNFLNGKFEARILQY